MSPRRSSRRSASRTSGLVVAGALTVLFGGVAALQVCSSRTSSNGDPDPTAASSDLVATNARPGASPAMKLTEDSPVRPLAEDRPSTTAPQIALGNLDAQIESHEQMLARNADDTTAACALVELLLARAEYTSRITDAERALATAEGTSRRHPEDGNVRLAHASALGTFHSFGRALAELDAAADAKAPPDAVSRARATLFMAQGRFDEAAALAAWNDAEPQDPLGMASAAVLAGERAEFDASERLFERARHAYRDVSPFPVAWMDLQHALLLERRGQSTLARRYLEEAHRILPSYGHATVHLAAYLPIDEAVDELAIAVAHTDDPQVEAAHSDALRRAGRSAEAAAAAERARLRYEQLLAVHPDAFAEHGARFYLEILADPARALPLARRNATLRQTDAALDLLMLASQAAGTPNETCEAALRAKSFPYASNVVTKTAVALLSGCTGSAAMTSTR